MKNFILRSRSLTSKEKSKVKTFLLESPVIQVKEGVIKADKNGTAIFFVSVL